jgi:hypothetical protein
LGLVGVVGVAEVGGMMVSVPLVQEALLGWSDRRLEPVSVTEATAAAVRSGALVLPAAGVVLADVVVVGSRSTSLGI